MLSIYFLEHIGYIEIPEEPFLTGFINQISGLDHGAWKPETQEMVYRVEILTWGHTGKRGAQDRSLWELGEQPLSSEAVQLLLFLCNLSIKEEAGPEIWRCVQERDG